MRPKPTVRNARDTFPSSIIELIDHLDTMCPEPMHNPSDDISKIMFEAGRRDLVHQIRREFARSIQRLEK